MSSFLKVLVLNIGHSKWFWELNYTSICWLSANIKQHVTHKGLHSRSSFPPSPFCTFVPIPYHYNLIFSKEKRKIDLHFPHLWILTTVELRRRIIFFLHSVIFEWSSLSFQFKYLKLMMFLPNAQIDTFENHVEQKNFRSSLDLRKHLQTQEILSKMVQNYSFLPPCSHTHHNTLDTFSKTITGLDRIAQFL